MANYILKLSVSRHCPCALPSSNLNSNDVFTHYLSYSQPNSTRLTQQILLDKMKQAYLECPKNVSSPSTKKERERKGKKKKTPERLCGRLNATSIRSIMNPQQMTSQNRVHSQSCISHRILCLDTGYFPMTQMKRLEEKKREK